MIRRSGDDTVHAAVGCGGGGVAKELGEGLDNAPVEHQWGTTKGRGEGQSLWTVGGRARPSVFFDSTTYVERERGGGDR